MTPIRETIASAIFNSQFGGTDDPTIASMMEAIAFSSADAVLRDIDEAGCVVVETNAASEARRGMEWFERTFGVPLGDMPGRKDVERVRAMISASVVE